MHTYLRDQIDWESAFPPEEYAERLLKVRQEMSTQGIATLYVTTPANLTWLTGYDMIWYHLNNLTGLLIQTDTDDTVFFDSAAHTTIVSTTPGIAEVVYFERDGKTPADVILDEMKSRGATGSSVGLELWGYAPHASVMEELAQKIRDTGAEVGDRWTLIEELRLIKSPRELAHVRKAAAIADEAMAAARDAIRPGVSETELEAVIMHHLMTAGGGYPGIRTMLGSGPRAGTHHGPPSRRQIKQGDLVFIDFCGCYERYHVNVNRTFSLGQPDPRWVDLMDKAAGCIDAILSEIKVGQPMSEVEVIAQRYTDEVGLRKYVWWVGGYSLGIALPPDWCGSHWLQPRSGLPDRALAPGIVFNLENQFDVWEDWPGGSGCAYIETLLVTESGLEVLSKLPRHLVVVD